MYKDGYKPKPYYFEIKATGYVEIPINIIRGSYIENCDTLEKFLIENLENKYGKDAKINLNIEKINR